jgi:nucleotide-binding universal stress UspA family protein
MKNRVVAIATERGPDQSCAWAKGFLLKPGDEVHLLSVKYKVPGGMIPVPYMASNGENIVSEVYTHTVDDETNRVETLLKTTAESMFNDFQPKVHALEPIGGASGVGESIVNWVGQNNCDLLVLGPVREKNAKSMLMTMLGFSSVSHYSLHRLQIPICIIHELDTEFDQEGSRVLVSVDGSAAAENCLKWAIENILNDDSQLHIVSVVLEAPYDIAEEDSGAAHVLSQHETEQENASLHQMAQNIVQQASQTAISMGVQPENIISTTIQPELGSNEIAGSIKKYSEANDISIVCLGTRSMTSVQRAVSSIFGTGSVSDWCASHLKTPTVIVPLNRE